MGKPATDRRRALGIGRKLCRFQLESAPGQHLGESCLVLRHGEPVGHVTSVVKSPTLRRTIGLAYADPADARPGGTIRLRDRSGCEVSAPVVGQAFYDPDNARQEA